MTGTKKMQISEKNGIVPPIVDDFFKIERCDSVENYVL